jgi:hypothetical protein
MKSRMIRKVAVLVTGSALALSFPVAGAIADSGGVPHEGSKGKGKQQKNKGTQPRRNGGQSCPTWSNGKGVQIDLPQQAANGQGLKCGFFFSGLTAAP